MFRFYDVQERHPSSKLFDKTIYCQFKDWDGNAAGNIKKKRIEKKKKRVGFFEYSINQNHTSV